MNRLRVAASVLVAAVAVSAYAGVVGLVTGDITFGEDIDGRLPFDSHVLAGFALLLVVALPMTAAAVALWRRTPHAVDLLEGAGVLLVVWIAVQLAFIRTYSWFHPTYLLIAVAVLATAAALRALEGGGRAPRTRVRAEGVSISGSLTGNDATDR